MKGINVCEVSMYRNTMPCYSYVWYVKMSFAICNTHYEGWNLCCRLRILFLMQKFQNEFITPYSILFWTMLSLKSQSNIPLCSVNKIPALPMNSYSLSTRICYWLSVYLCIKKVVTRTNMAVTAKWDLAHNTYFAGKYFHNMKILSTRVKGGDSFNWRSITWGRKRGLRWRLYSSFDFLTVTKDEGSVL